MIIEKVESNEKLNKFVDDEFARYEKQNEVHYNHIPFSFIAKENDEIMGVVAGHTCFFEVYISDLAVREKDRGKNIGSQLIQAVEEYYTGHGFENINLCTYGFQAPEFYEKLGFQLEFVRKNKANPKMNKYYFVKYFNDEK